MSKKILVFLVLFSTALSMTISQEANALTQGRGNDSHTTASMHPSKVCGFRICAPGENSIWAHAIGISQRDGYGKATGGYLGQVIMNQLVVNSLLKQSLSNVVWTGEKTGTPSGENLGMSDSSHVMKNMWMNNQTSTVPMNNQTSIGTNSTG